MLDMAGSSLPEILQNVNSMHGHMKVAYFNKFRPPNIRVTQVKEDSMTVHYVSGTPSRGGILGPLLIGIIKALAEIQLRIDSVQVKQKKFISKGADHDVFSVKWSVQHGSADSYSNTEEDFTLSLQYGLSPTALNAIFPFHLIFNSKLEIIQYGRSLSRLVPMMEVGDNVTSHFTLVSPHTVTLEPSSFKAIIRTAKTDPFCLSFNCADISASRDKSGNDQSSGATITMKGQMTYSKSEDTMIYVASPLISSLEQAQQFSLNLSDFAIHDPTKDLMFVNQQSKDQIKRCPVPQYNKPAKIKLDTTINNAGKKIQGTSGTPNLLLALFGSKMTTGTSNSKKKSSSSNSHIKSKSKYNEQNTVTHQNPLKESKENQQTYNKGVGASPINPQTNIINNNNNNTGSNSNNGNASPKPNEDLLLKDPLSNSTGTTTTTTTKKAEIDGVRAVSAHGVTTASALASGSVTVSNIGVTSSSSSEDLISKRSLNAEKKPERENTNPNLNSVLATVNNNNNNNNAALVSNNNNNNNNGGVSHTLDDDAVILKDKRTMVSSRTREAFVNLLLEDTWTGHHLIRELLKIYMQEVQGDSLYSAVADFYSYHNKNNSFMRFLVEDEVSCSSEQPELLFRSQSVGIKYISLYLRKLGENYAKNLVKPLIKQVEELKGIEMFTRGSGIGIGSGGGGGSGSGGGSGGGGGSSSTGLTGNAAGLKEARRDEIDSFLKICQDFLDRVCKSAKDCPVELRKLLLTLSNEVEKRFPEMYLTSVTSLLFLRFICPALLTGETMKDEKKVKILTMVSKVVQNLANGKIEFDGSKEAGMGLFNVFIAGGEKGGNWRKLQKYMKELLNEEMFEEEWSARNMRATTSAGGNVGGIGQMKYSQSMVVIRDCLLNSMDKLWITASVNQSVGQLLKRFCCVGLCSVSD